MKRPALVLAGLLLAAACGGGGSDEATLTRADGSRITASAQREHVDSLIEGLGFDFVCSPALLATSTPEPHQTRADVEGLHRIHVEACEGAGR